MPAGSDYWTPAYDIRVTRLHMEEDAGKLLHEGFPDSARKSYVDLNRAGTPLVEIVTEPDFRSARDAAAFFAYLRELLVAIGVNDGNMEEGSLRCDANVSVRPAGSGTLGTKAEIKNLNSFRFLEEAIAAEVERQVAALEAGERIVQETRLWDAGARRDRVDAEQGRGARLPVFPRARSAAARRRRRAPARAAGRDAARLPAARRRRLQDAHGLAESDAVTLTLQGLDGYFEAAVGAGADAKAAKNWLLGRGARGA